MSSLDRTFEKSREIQCKHHLYQFGKANGAYSEDHQNKLPVTGYYDHYATHGSKMSNSRVWKFQIGDYVYGQPYQYYSWINQGAGVGRDYSDTTGNNIPEDLYTKVFECPKAKELEAIDGKGPYVYEDLNHSRRGGYGINGAMFNAELKNAYQSGQLPTGSNGKGDVSLFDWEISRPSETVFYADTLFPTVSRTWPYKLLNPDRMIKNGHFYSWHDFGINIMWTDLHVSNMADPELKLGDGDNPNYYFDINK